MPPATWADESSPLQDGTRTPPPSPRFSRRLAVGAFGGFALVSFAAVLAVARVGRPPSASREGPAWAPHQREEEDILGRVVPYEKFDRNNRRVLEYDWKVTATWDRRPDCMTVDERWPRRVVLVNGQGPVGPAIYATKGDIVKVKITNMIQPTDLGHDILHGISVHWHGLKQRSGTQWSDGVGWMHQCPIAYNESYTYVMDTAEDSAGTHWWHAHSGSDNADGLYGAFVILDPPRTSLPEEVHYDADLPPLFVQGWWNYSAPTLEWGLMQPVLRWVANPQSVLMNGKGVAGPSLDKRHEPGNTAGCDLTAITTWFNYDVEPGKTYRLRVIAAGTLLPINLTMPGHRMTVVEADGEWVKPREVDELLINLGQRYSILFTADQPVDNYPIIASVYGRQARSGQCAVEYRKTFDMHWPEGSFSFTQSCGGVSPEDDFEEARRAALDGDGIESNFRLPAGLALVHYEGASQHLTYYAAQPYPYPDEASLLKGLTVNWIQNMTEDERDSLSATVAAYENDFAAHPKLAHSKLPSAREPLRITMGMQTWWPGTLPEADFRQAGLEGYITAPTVSQGPGRAGPLPVYKWAVNNVTQAFLTKRGAEVPRDRPLTTQAYARTLGYDFVPNYEVRTPGEHPTWTLGNFAWEVEYGTVVDILIVNDDLAEEHPWHMHGYCFHVLGHGVGKFDPSTASEVLNLKDPICRDTTQVLPQSWALIRVKFDNPGVWYFHCHMDWHLELGLGAMFIVKDGPRPEDKLPRPPNLNDYRLCNAPVASSWNGGGYPKFGTGSLTGLDKDAPEDAEAKWVPFGAIPTYADLSRDQVDAMKQAIPTAAVSESHGIGGTRHPPVAHRPLGSTMGALHGPHAPSADHGDESAAAVGCSRVSSDGNC